MRTALVAMILALGAIPALAQSDETRKLVSQWEYYAEVTGNFVPDGGDYAAPVIMADRDWLHLEARYNYEDQNTTSVWGGYSFKSGGDESLVVTPMLGGVFGDTDGVAAGVEVIADWKRLDLYVEGEHLFASGDDEEDFTYFWSELTYRASDWFRAGLVSQRTRAIETDVGVMRGALVVLTFENVYLYTSLFEPGSDDETLVVSLGAEF
ncbi:MAG: hypothetical protein WC538_15385 [Thermoanaerobaculia bacterium]|jgi:hypothetical protein